MSLRVENVDVAIIGAGPAGLSAALWCADLGLRAIVLEPEAVLGGQLNLINNRITNYPGTGPIDATDFKQRLVRQICATDVAVRESSPIAKVDLKRKTLVLAAGRDVAAKALIIATGVRRRLLHIPGEIEFLNKGILSSGMKQRNDVKGKKIVIIGGGDAALENALLLSDHADLVTVVHRGTSFSARSQFADSAVARANIEFRFSAVVKAIDGTSAVDSVSVSVIGSDKQIRIPADAVLIRIGVVPNSEMFASSVTCDDKGYIKVDRDCATNLELVYAIGDIASPASPTISTAVGMGSTAAKHIESRLSSALSAEKPVR